MIDIDVDLSPIMILLIFSRQLRNQKETTESPKIPPNWLLRLQVRLQTTRQACIRSRDVLQTGLRILQLLQRVNGYVPEVKPSGW